jgi:hypothetical protein
VNAKRLSGEQVSAHDWRTSFTVLSLLFHICAERLTGECQRPNVR